MSRPDDSGDFSGIDPQKLWDLINSIKNRTGYDGDSGAQPVVNNWMSQANRIGLDTSGLSTINRHLSWSQDQLPMLRRRHSLAVDGAKEAVDFGGGTGMVSAGAESLGTYKTQAEAEKAAKDDAQAYEDGKLSLQDYFRKLQANQFDPDYAKAASNALGDAKLHQLQQGSFAYDPEHPQAGMSILANFVATAMRNGATLKDSFGNEDLQLLAGLVPHAAFPKDVLANLGKQCLAPGNYMYGKYIWPALAADPAAAAQFLHDNMDMIPQWMAGNSDHHGGLPDSQVKDFAAVIKAGTIGGPGTDASMAADNTTKLVTYYSSHDDEHTHPEIQQVFAQDIKFYWSDLQASLTDPAPVDLGPGHVSVKGEAWEGFIHEAMQDPKATAALLSYSKQMANQLADGDPGNPAVQHAAGILDGTFAYEATKVYQERKAAGDQEAEDWQDTVSEQLSTAISTGVEVAFSPGEAVKTISKAAINDVLTTFSGSMVKMSPDSMGDPPTTATWRDVWTEAAHQKYQRNHNLGNPRQYADTYSSGKPFLSDDGHLIDNPTAGQKQAYNEWLKDSAVANELNDWFMQRDHGRSTSASGVH